MSTRGNIDLSLGSGIHKWSYLRDGLVYPDESFGNINTRFARTAKDLLLYTESRYKGYTILPITDDNMVLSTRANVIMVINYQQITVPGVMLTYLWINHTGMLNTWTDVKQFYRIL
jgi:hypothetical protein